MSALADKHAKAMAKRDAKILRDVARGVPVLVIARRLELSPQRVYQILNATERSNP